MFDSLIQLCEYLPGSIDSQEALLEELENRVREETAVDVALQGQIQFSVWVSFAEIYNEQIFDLLEPIPKKKDTRRPVLKLSEDRRGSPYIKGEVLFCLFLFLKWIGWRKDSADFDLKEKTKNWTGKITTKRPSPHPPTPNSLLLKEISYKVKLGFVTAWLWL